MGFEFPNHSLMQESYSMCIKVFSVIFNILQDCYLVESSILQLHTKLFTL